MDLTRGANGVRDDSEAARAVVEARVGLRSVCRTAGRHGSRSPHGEGIIELVLRDFVSGNVEAGGVGEVVHVQRVLHAVFFAEAEDLLEGGVGTALGLLAEDVALAGGEAGFERI